MGKSVGSIAYDWHARLVALGEAGVRLRRPLHRRSRAISLRQFKVVSHPDLVAISDYGCTRQRHHQAICKFQPPTVTLQHGCESSPDPAIVELHFWIRSERREDAFALFLRQVGRDRVRRDFAKTVPIARWRAATWSLALPLQAVGIAAGQREKQMLIHLKIEHHLQPLA